MCVKDSFGCSQPSPLLLLAFSMALMGPGLYPVHQAARQAGLWGLLAGAMRIYSLIARLLMPVISAVEAAKPFSFSSPF